MARMDGFLVFQPTISRSCRTQPCVFWSLPLALAAIVLSPSILSAAEPDSAEVGRPSCLAIKYLKADEPRRYFYEYNIHHQSEYLFPAMDRIVNDYTDAAPLETLLSDLPLVPWITELLRLVAPSLTVIADRKISNTRHRSHQAAVRACGDLALVPRVEKAKKGGAYFSHASTLAAIRKATAAKCGLPIPRRCNATDGSRVRVTFLDRHVRRRLHNVDEAMAVVRRGFDAEVNYRKTFDHATLCQQAEWFSGVDAMVVAHGQQMTNSIFLPSDAVVVELLPWSLVKYKAYLAAMANSGVRFTQVVAHNGNYKFLKEDGGAHTQKECVASLECYRHYRDKVPLIIKPGDLVAALRKAGGVHKVC